MAPAPGWRAAGAGGAPWRPSISRANGAPDRQRRCRLSSTRDGWDWRGDASRDRHGRPSRSLPASAYRSGDSDIDVRPRRAIHAAQAKPKPLPPAACGDEAQRDAHGVRESGRRGNSARRVGAAACGSRHERPRLKRRLRDDGRAGRSGRRIEAGSVLPACSLRPCRAAATARPAGRRTAAGLPVRRRTSCSAWRPSRMPACRRRRVPCG